jgi:hypothetical protein
VVERVAVKRVMVERDISYKPELPLMWMGSDHRGSPVYFHVKAHL